MTTLMSSYYSILQPLYLQTYSSASYDIFDSNLESILKFEVTRIGKTLYKAEQKKQNPVSYIAD